MELKLIVLRTANIEILSDFYSLLGMNFEYHKHGNSPYHFSSTINQTVVEIYPLAKNQIKPDENLRLGFAIDNFESIIQLLRSKETIFAAEPFQTDFGFMAIIKDPDGRKIELYRK